MFESLSEILAHAEEEGRRFFEIVLSEDAREQGTEETESFEGIRRMYRAMCEADSSYDPSLLSMSGLTGTQGAKLQEYRQKRETVCGPFLAQVTERALKTAESNACMKRIVAAPTAGSCGVLPALLITMQERFALPEEEMVRALIVAGGIGGVIAARASLSGAEGGCQAEVGSASAMAAGAAVYLQGGSDAQIVQAAAIALKNLLGLACDPVAGLVEVPCVKRNVVGAVNAAAAADMALAGIESFIPPDEVIDAMKRIGRSLPEDIRESGTGGLAATPTGKAFAGTI